VTSGDLKRLTGRAPRSLGDVIRQRIRTPRVDSGNRVEAPGIEPDLWQIENTMEHVSGTISTDGDPADVSDRASKCAIVRGVVTESSDAYELSNVVETALARALVLAAEAGRWDVVVHIAEELGARRLGMQQARGRANLGR
jgi:hypothetical protein